MTKVNEQTQSTQRKILRDAAEKQLPDMVIIVALLEHQLDLISKILIDLEDDISPENKPLFDKLKALMEYSSVDFDNLDHPLEAYKIPKAIDNKARTRIIQSKYLQAQAKAGLLT